MKIQCDTYEKGFAELVFASADVDTIGVVKSVAGVKTRNPDSRSILRKLVFGRQNIPTPIGLLGSNLYSKQHPKFQGLFYFVYTYLHCLQNKLRHTFILRNLLSDRMV